MSNLHDLLAQQAALEKQIHSLQQAARIEAIAEIRALMAQSGLTVADLASRTPAGAKKEGGSKVAPKYRNPATGQTWSGRGLKPKWMQAAIGADQSPADFAI